MANRNSVRVSRVVLPLDLAADFASAAELAASVAAGWELTLKALFVEDEDLRRLAGLPFARQVDTATAASAPLNEAKLGADLAVQARRMRQAVEAAAFKLRLPWSFETLRAPIEPEALGFSEDELLVIDVGNRHVASHFRITSPWRRIVDRLRQPLLVIPDAPKVAGPVAALHDLSEAGDQVFDAAWRVARPAKRPLTVLFPGGADAARRQEIERNVHDRPVEVSVSEVAVFSPPLLGQFVRATGTTLLVLKRNQVERDGIEELLFSPPSALLVL